MLKQSATTADQLIAEYFRFKKRIVECRPCVVLSLVSIPTASFSKFQCSKNLRECIISDDLLQLYQTDLDSVLDSFNTRIKFFNQELQLGIATRTLSWHTSVRKSSKRKTRSGTYNTKLRNSFSPLYDGLHAVSGLKQRWFTELHRSFASDAQTLVARPGFST